MSEASSPSGRPPITQVLQQLAAGESGAADRLLPLVYDELRALANQRMVRERAGQTLGATALVHEAWLRLGAHDAVRWDSRAHFFGAAARAMRFILVEQARQKSRKKRGGEHEHRPLSTDIATPQETSDFDLEALDQALSQLEQEHPRHARIVMLRYFGGLSMEEIAGMVGVSQRTADRDWAFARAWLRCVLDARCAGEA